MGVIYDHSDDELDALIQDLGHKIGNAKILNQTSMYKELSTLLESYMEEKNARTAKAEYDNEPAESDPLMEGVPFVPPTRKIETF